MTLAAALQQVPAHLLQDELRRRHQTLPRTVRAVLDAVAQAWEAEADEVRLLVSRETSITHPRQAAMVLLRASGLTLTAVAQVFRNGHHSTIIHAVRTHPKRMRDPHFARRFEVAKALLPVP